MDRTAPEAPLEQLVRKARAGDADSFGEIVRQFQDTALGYAWALLRDADEAAEAAQEAFVEAWQQLPRLRHEAAFAAWFRRVLHKQCDRRLRRMRVVTRHQASATDERNEEPAPDMLSERGERAERLRSAVASLPEELRTATLLHYYSGLSLREIALLLEIPVGTVKSRLHSARQTLRHMDLRIFAEDLGMTRPSEDEQFREQIRSLILAAGRGDVPAVQDVVRSQPELIEEAGPHPLWGGRPRALHVAVERGRVDVVRELLSAGADPSPDSTAYDGWTPIFLAASGGHAEIAALLLEAGASIDAWTAAVTGDAVTLEALIGNSPELANAVGPNKATPLHFAATLAVARLLVRAGADLTIRDKYRRTPVRTTAYGRGTPREVGRFLRELSTEDDAFLRCALDDLDAVEAAVRRKPELLTAFDEYLNAGTGSGGSLLHIAASLSNHAMATLLLDLGADPNVRALEGEVPLHYAARFGDVRMVRLLLSRGADTELRDAVQDATPAAWADFFGHREVLPLLGVGG